jgi:hypothetical protein
MNTTVPIKCKSKKVPAVAESAESIMTSSEHKHQKRHTLFIQATNLEKLFYKG